MPTREVVIVNKLGLHARAAARLVKAASGFDCDIRLRRNEREVSAKSIMMVMMLAAGRGTRLELVAEGQDAEQALDCLARLVANGFDEDE